MFSKLYLVPLLFAATVASAQVPPPPLPSGFRDLNAELTRAFNGQDITGYEKLLAQDLQVFDSGRPVASSKDEWLRIVKKLVGPRSSIRSVGVVLNADGSFYVMDQLTVRAAWWGRVLKYQVRNDKIIRIDFLSGYGGGFPLLKPDSMQMDPSWK